MVVGIKMLPSMEMQSEHALEQYSNIHQQYVVENVAALFMKRGGI